MGQELKKIKQFESPQHLNDYLATFGGGIVEQVGDEIDRIEENIKVCVYSLILSVI